VVGLGTWQFGGEWGKGHRFDAERFAERDWDVAELRSDAWGAREVVAQLDASLRALGTDYVDVYQAHGGQDAPFDSPGLWDALHKEVAKGKIRHLGVRSTQMTSARPIALRASAPTSFRSPTTG